MGLDNIPTPRHFQTHYTLELENSWEIESFPQPPIVLMLSVMLSPTVILDRLMFLCFIFLYFVHIVTLNCFAIVFVGD